MFLSIVLYSKPFGTNGTFENNDDNDPFSLVLTESHTEQWYIWIITDERGTNEKVWNGYGLNDTSATNKYYRYMVPDNQNQTIFGFVSVGYTDNNATGDKLSDLTEIISLLRNKPTTGTHVIKCIDGVLTWVTEP